MKHEELTIKSLLIDGFKESVSLGLRVYLFHNN